MPVLAAKLRSQREKEVASTTSGGSSGSGDGFNGIFKLFQMQFMSKIGDSIGGSS
jgi:hypothetical protein